MGRLLAVLMWVAAGAAPLATALAAPEGLPDNTPPAIELLLPPPGSALREFFSLEVQFSEPVWGVEASDLLINGLPATNVTEAAPGLFLFTFVRPPDGLVCAAWRADHGITDRADPPNLFAGGEWSYTLDTTSPAPGVMISEFMADNRRTLHDEDGESPDWIELYNSGTTAANLDGWFLTDTAANLTQWRFPNVAVAANGYLVVFASEKNRTNPTNRLHTNFRLAKEGGYLALLSPRTNVVSEFAPGYPKQYEDVSYGRAPGEPQAVGYFVKPTPGAPNAASGPGFAPAVDFSRPSGTFTAAFDLSLSTGAGDAVIRYTVDGNMPTNISPAYAGPIHIINSIQVRARAFQEGLFPGPPRSEAYVLLADNLVNFTSDLPVMIIHSLGKGAPAAGRYSFAHLSVYEPVNGCSSLTNAPALAARAGLRIRGSSTEGYPKSSFAVELWDEFNQDNHRPLLGMPADSDWVLYAPNNFEPVLIHNPFIHQLSRDLGCYSPRTRFVEVYLNRTTGPVSSTHYTGIYVLEEKIKIGPQRVAIDKLEPEHVKPPEVTGGYLLKIDRLDPGDSGFTAGGQTMCYVDPKERDIRLPQRDPQEQYIKNYFNSFNAALTGAKWRDPQAGYPLYVEGDAWIDYHVLEVLSGNVDALVLSAYLYKARNGKITFGPHWDFDRALGSTDGRDANPRVWTTGPFFVGWYARLFKDPDFWQKWVDRWQELRGTHFANTNLNALIDQLAGEVRQAQPREFKKWRVTLRGGSFQSEVNLMKNWLSNRMDFIDKQLAPPPRLSAPGGPVPPDFLLTISGPPGATVYYTWDGSDPRAAQGGVAPQAIISTGPIRLSANARVVARARNLNARQTGGPPTSTPWSGPVAATFVVKPPPLLVTELMFHPAPVPGLTNSASDFEFIELKNISAERLNLAGYRFTNGIVFTFTATNGVTDLDPGQRVVLAKNRAALLGRYPGLTNVVGDYAGSLANDNDRLVLIGPMLESVLDFSYSNRWQPLADGLGFSLVLADEQITPSQLGESDRWRLSAQPGGSPALPDPPPPALPPVFVNELLAYPLAGHQDALELFNPNSFPVGISGWFISDEFMTPQKFRVPDGAVIPAEGYVVFDADYFGGSMGTGFGFDRLGDEVYLFSADANGQLTGWMHGFAFGPSPRGTTFGRYVTSTGQEQFVLQEQPTLGSANTGPRVGPVVIGEVMYGPAPDGTNSVVRAQFIELQNLSANEVKLLDPDCPTNTWRLRGAVDYDFPTNAVLGPNQALLVVGFDPQTDTAALAAFRASYQVDPLTPIYGPWLGRLESIGEPIRLLAPGGALAPPADGQAPYLLVEQVACLPGLARALNAASGGLSLQRREARAFGDDPTNWVAGPPTPGTADSDADGLPDGWEIAASLNPFSGAGDDGPDGDPDRDGFTNMQEFLSGTLPNDGGSGLRLQLERERDGRVSLRFAAAPARSYSIYYCDSLASGAWRACRTWPATTAGRTVTFTDTPLRTARFYRLQVP
jgi:hypothetical protein